MTDLSPPTVHRKLNTHLWWITALIIGINIALFAVEVINGMDISNPRSSDAILWGADYAPLTFLVEPFRLFTSMFFHFGLIHLMLNMWALYIFGNIAEQLYGRFYFISLYLLAGLFGSLLSGYISIQNSIEIMNAGIIDPELLPRVSAGASGAVMGLGASLTLLSLLPPLAKQKFLLDKKTLLIMMGLNLVFGLTVSGINNAAHVGGMIMGVILTGIWYLGQKLSKPLLVNLLGIILGTIFCYLFFTYCMSKIEFVRPLWQALLEQTL